MRWGRMMEVLGRWIVARAEGFITREMDEMHNSISRGGEGGIRRAGTREGPGLADDDGIYKVPWGEGEEGGQRSLNQWD